MARGSRSITGRGFQIVLSAVMAVRNISGLDLVWVWAPQLFYTYFYNHAHRLRHEKLLYTEVSRSPSGYFKPLLDPGGGFRSETAFT